RWKWSSWDPAPPLRPRSPVPAAGPPEPLSPFRASFLDSEKCGGPSFLLLRQQRVDLLHRGDIVRLNLLHRDTRRFELRCRWPHALAPATIGSHKLPPHLSLNREDLLDQRSIRLL